MIHFARSVFWHAVLAVEGAHLLRQRHTIVDPSIAVIDRFIHDPIVTAAVAPHTAAVTTPEAAA
jgi:hypothetical protein